MVSTLFQSKKIFFSLVTQVEVLLLLLLFFDLSLPHRLQNRALSNRAAYLEVERECGTQAMCAEKSQVMCAENADF